MSIMVAGGAGFIGANFLLDWFRHHDETIINTDKLTYAGNLENFVSLQGDARYRFVRGNIGDSTENRRYEPSSPTRSSADRLFQYQRTDSSNRNVPLCSSE